ncbi:MAG: NAD(P)-dependent oxidoreductase [Desulfomonile tiedjei]|uniref:NAD(P)-dependent oxidoreductase n=1 Tax=Desulfomonile tiedjei TaxID=2358 RepID=A0A9D6Z3G3_9BACT|nr:NAD(P)-dependent oxidoreductase [Desulfomonile tiedjei]
MRVGFVGLGTMGKGMAKNLLKAGFALTVYDIRKELCDELQQLGAKVAGSLKELGAANKVVVSMVFDDNQTREVLFGKDGVLEGLKQGTLIITSNLSPSFIRTLTHEVDEGVSILDAPVSGGSVGADAGTLAIMVGGKKEVFEQYRALFEAMGKNIFYCGGSSTGLMAKLTNNMILEGTVALVLESMALGTAVGLDPALLLNIYNTSTGESWVTKYWDFVTEWRTTRPNTLVSLHKDVDLALAFAGEVGISLPITSFLHKFDLSERG